MLCLPLERGFNNNNHEHMDMIKCAWKENFVTFRTVKFLCLVCRPFDLIGVMIRLY